MIKSSFFRLKKKQTNVLACWGNKCKPNFPEIKLHYLWLINWAHRDVRECFGDFRFTCFYMTEFFCSSLLKRATVFMCVLWLNFPCKFGAYLLRLTRAIMYFDGSALSRCVWVFFSFSFIYFFGFIYDCDCFFLVFFTVPPSVKAVNHVVGAPVGSHVLLECTVEVFPKPLNGWYRNDGK